MVNHRVELIDDAVGNVTLHVGSLIIKVATRGSGKNEYATVTVTVRDNEQYMYSIADFTKPVGDIEPNMKNAEHFRINKQADNVSSNSPNKPYKSKYAGEAVLAVYRSNQK